MSPLQEYKRTRQVKGEPRKRWFTSQELDLFVWFDKNDEPIGFQFCYDKQLGEHSISWDKEKDFRYTAVDDGGSLKHKGSPILVPNGATDLLRVLRIFDNGSKDLPVPAWLERQSEIDIPFEAVEES